MRCSASSRACATSSDRRRAGGLHRAARRARRRSRRRRRAPRSSIGCARCAPVVSAAGEPARAIEAAVAAIGDSELAALAPALATCQLWYCEAATSALSPAAQLGVLAAAVGAAHADRRRHVAAVARAAAAAARAARRRRAPRCATGCGWSRPRSRSARLRELLTGNASARAARHAVGAARASRPMPDAIVDRLRRQRRERRAGHAARHVRDALAGAVPSHAQVAVRPLRAAQGRLRSRRERGELPRDDERGALRQGAHARLRQAGPRSSRSARAAASCSTCSRQRFPDGRDHRRRSVARGGRRARGARARRRSSLARRARRGRGAARARRTTSTPSCSARSSTRSTRTRRRGSRWPRSSASIRAACAALAPGGRIVIRDGVMPPPRHAPHPVPRPRRARRRSTSTSRSSRAGAIRYRELAPIASSCPPPTRWSSSTRTRGARRRSRTRCASSTASCTYDDVRRRARRSGAAGARVVDIPPRRCAATCSRATATTSPARSS